jgi:tetratricopeptide (TPR) repeat protein
LACDKQPVLPRAFYNYALKLYQTERYKATVETAAKGLEIVPDDESLLYVKLLGLIKLGKTTEASQVVLRLIQINPDNPDYKNIMMQIQRQISGNQK